MKKLIAIYRDSPAKVIPVLYKAINDASRERAQIDSTVNNRVIREIIKLQICVSSGININMIILKIQTRMYGIYVFIFIIIEIGEFWGFFYQIKALNYR